MPRQSHESVVMSPTYHVIFSCASRRMHSSSASFEDSGERSARTERERGGLAGGGWGRRLGARCSPVRSPWSLVCGQCVQMHGCYVDRDLAFGSFGTDVSCLQEHLGRVARTRGAQGTSRLYEGPVTGHFGEKTQEAVAAWQVRRLWRLGGRRRAADSVCVRVALCGCEGLGGGGRLVILTREICFVPFGFGPPACVHRH